MILSAQLLMSDDQAITATALSTNIIDLGVAGTPFDAQGPLNQDVGKGCPIPLLIQVTEDFDALTSLTITVEVSADEAFSAPVVLATEVKTLAELTAGLQTYCQVIPNGADQRYIGVRYTVDGAAPTVGTVTAGISMGNQTNVTGA